MSTPRSLIYAELLSNIRQISIIAALDSPCDSTTKAELSADGHQIILHHGGTVTSLALPGQVSQAAQLQKPVLGSRELSWRLPVAGPAQGTRTGLEDAQKNDAPWSAKSLGEDAEFSCRKCGAVLLKRGSVKIWKDLPSENWAEMMDFWHCHKPDVHEPNDSSGHESHVDESGPVASKGYGADTKFAATSTVGFVDITTFLLANSDCSSLQIKPSSDQIAKTQTIYCGSCHDYIGYVDHQAEGVRLYKWRLSQSSPLIQRALPNSCSLPSPSSIISAQLVAIMQAQCISRLMIMTNSSKPSFHPSSINLTGPAPSPSLSSVLSSSGQCISSADLREQDNLDIPSSNGASPSPSSLALSIWVLQQSLRFGSSTISNAIPSQRRKSQIELETETQEQEQIQIQTQIRTNQIQNQNKSPMMQMLNKMQIQSPTQPKLEAGTFAMKVFWKLVSRAEADSSVESESAEEVLLPTEVIDEIKACLQESALILPPSARKFKEWDVGLLERYEE